MQPIKSNNGQSQGVILSNYAFESYANNLSNKKREYQQRRMAVNHNDTSTTEMSISQLAGAGQSVFAPRLPMAATVTEKHVKNLMINQTELSPHLKQTRHDRSQASIKMGKLASPYKMNNRTGSVGNIKSIKLGNDTRHGKHASEVTLPYFEKSILKPTQYVADFDHIRQNSTHSILSGKPSQDVTNEHVFTQKQVRQQKVSDQPRQYNFLTFKDSEKQLAAKAQAFRIPVNNKQNFAATNRHLTKKLGAGSWVDDYVKQDMERKGVFSLKEDLENPIQLGVTHSSRHLQRLETSITINKRSLPKIKDGLRYSSQSNLRKTQQSVKVKNKTKDIKYYDTMNFQSEFFGKTDRKKNDELFRVLVPHSSDPNPTSPRLEDEKAPTLREVLSKGPMVTDFCTNEPKMDSSLQRAKQVGLIKISQKPQRKNQAVYENFLNKKRTSLPQVAGNAHLVSEVTARDRTELLSMEMRRQTLSTNLQDISNGPQEQHDLDRNDIYEEQSLPIVTNARKSSVNLFPQNSRHQPEAEVFGGAYELSTYEHQLQNKLSRQLKKINKLHDSIGTGHSIDSSQTPNQNNRAAVMDVVSQEHDSLFEESNDHIQQELKRLKKNTISLKEDASIKQMTRRAAAEKNSAFYNASYFDRKFDKRGNLMPGQNQSRNEADSIQVSHMQKNGDKASLTESPLFGGNSYRSQSNIPSSKVTFKVKHKESVTGFWAQEVPNFAKQEDFDRQCKLFNLPSKSKERELLYKWAPGTRRKPNSDQFSHFLSRYESTDARAREKLRKKRKEDNEQFRVQMEDQTGNNEIKLEKREKRLRKADQAERKRQCDIAKGLRKHNDEQDPDQSDESYHTKVSEERLNEPYQVSNDSNDINADKEVELDDIFNQNEFQVRAMLEEAVKSKHQKEQEMTELGVSTPRVEMNDKQRINCLRFIQNFFAELADPLAMPVKEQFYIARDIRKKHVAQKQKDADAERDRIKKAFEAKASELQGLPMRAQNAEDIKSESSHESDYTDGADAQEEHKGDKKRRIVKIDLNDTQVNVKTDTKMQTDPFEKRRKMDQDIRKILLYKDYKSTDHKGDMDATTKLNQDYIRDTIAAYSGAISLPTSVVKKTLRLNDYFLGENVCFSLSRYFSSLQSNFLVELTLSSNGLKDASMATILRGIQGQRALRTLCYANNEMGKLTAMEISKILLWPPPTHLDTLRLINVKTTNFAMATVLSALKTNRKLLSLDLEAVEINNSKLFEYLCMFLKSNKVIKGLRLSWNSFFPKQIIQVMNLIKRRKTIQFLDLSNNSLAQEKRNLLLIGRFVDTMRRFILRTQIFHLNLMGMNLGKTVTKLIKAFKNSSTLNCVHLDMNNVPQERVVWMDETLQIPETHSPKVNKFRPFPPEVIRMQAEEKKAAAEKKAEGVSPGRRNSANQSDFDSSDLESSGDERRNNNGNVAVSGKLRVSKLDSLDELKEEKPLLKEHLINQLKQIQDQHLQKRNSKKQANNFQQQKNQKVSEMVTPVMQSPLIYQRILNHPEFCFPIFFKAQQGWKKPTQTDMIVNSVIQHNKPKVVSKSWFEVKKPNLDPRQDTIYFDQIFTNGWSKIESMSNQQIKAGKKGMQPDFTAEPGREGIVKTFHNDCWVCEKRKYTLLAVSTDPSIKGGYRTTWGDPITEQNEKERLLKKYLPNGQLPGRLQGQPILISSMNDWFPIHLMPVANFAMLFDYSLAQDISKGEALRRNTQDSVAKFYEGYQTILDHARNIKKMDAGSIRLYKAMWRNYILKNLLYPHDTLFIDFPAPDEEVDAEYLFMWAGFVKPGKHRSYLYDPADDKWYRRDFYVDEREEDLPNFANYENLYEDADDGLQSVLKDWKVDTPERLEECLNHDAERWGFNDRRWLKDMQEYTPLRESINDNISVIKDVFLDTAASSDFPKVTMRSLEVLVTECGLVDNRHISVKDVDRFFIAATTKDGSGKVTAMCRYEFIDFLARLSEYKYRETKVVMTCKEAFDKMMNEHIIPYHAQACRSWQLFRNRYLVGTIIDHVMFVNKTALTEIHQKYAQNTKNNKFTYESGTHLSKQLKLDLKETTILWCWGMSQQTVAEETNKKKDFYGQLFLIEFIEFLCRIIYARFSMNFDANLLGPEFAIIAATLQEKPMNAAQDATNPSRQMLPDDEEKEQAHGKLLYAYKEFICKTLKPFFDSLDHEFIDPDDDNALPDSEESEYDYPYSDGYSSQDSNNPEFVRGMGSGSESISSDEAAEPNFDDISNSIMSQMIQMQPQQSAVKEQHKAIIQRQTTKRKNQLMMASDAD